MNEQQKIEQTTLTPFLIKPVLTERIWGKKDLRPWFDYQSETKPVGEAWLTGDECVVESGRLKGSKLGEVFAAHAGLMLGAKLKAKLEKQLGAGFLEAASPLLIKLIFAQGKLSVQVHPDDALAQKYGDPRGKTECWYAVEAEAGAEVACGLKAGTTIEDVRRGIAEHTLENDLDVLGVEEGEMIFVDAGTVHAIWPGSVLLETQQNCDLTYRLYDYGRPRELHIEKGLEAIKLETKAGKIAPVELSDRTLLVDAEYFRIERLKLKGALESGKLLGAEKSLSYLFVSAGQVRVKLAEGESLELNSSVVLAVPAETTAFVCEPEGDAEMIRMVAQ